MKGKLPKITSTQAFSPVREIRDGTVITKDGRYVRILEFSPINFLLRSQKEQAQIISEFAAALRSMPARLHFKVMSSRADTASHERALADAMKREENANCRVLQEDQMRMIRSIGLKGISRRFFLIFEHEPGEGAPKEFVDIQYALLGTENRIVQMLASCGNETVSGRDDGYVMSVLYSVLSRRDAAAEPFGRHAEKVRLRYGGADIPVNDMICPSSIDTRPASHMTCGGLCYAFFYVPSTAFPSRCVGGWLSMLMNMGDGIDVDLFTRREDAASVRTRLQLRLRANKVRLAGADDTSSDYSDIAGAVRSGYYIRDGMAAGEDFHYMSVLLTVTAENAEQLKWKSDALKEACASRNLRIKPCLFQEEEAFLSAMPLACEGRNIFRKSRRNILTSSLAAAYPFVSFEIADEHGVMLGINRANNSLVFLDPFDSSKYKNANMVILGQAGSGKTYTLQCLALRLRQMDTQVFIIAPDKGHEFKRACRAIGGQYVNIATGSESNINVMEIRRLDNAASEAIDGSGDGTSVLAMKMQQLHTFFSLLIPDMSYEERQLLDEALIRTYAGFGITPDNASLEDPERPGRYRPMPVLGDLHAQLGNEGERARRLYNILTRYVTGSASSFNAQTNVNLDNRYVVMNLTSLSEEMLPIGMFIALDYVWDKVREDRTRPKAVIMDELWELIGAKSSKEAARFVLRIFKVIRGYAGSAIGATQDLNDFFALEGGAYGRGIINNSNIKFVMNLDSEEAERVSETMKLTQTEVEQISRFKRGEGLLAVGTNHVLVDFRASQSENDLITTDPRQLRELARKYGER